MRSIAFLQVERQHLLECITLHKGDFPLHVVGGLASRSGSMAARNNSAATPGSMGLPTVPSLPVILEALQRVKAVCPTHEEYVASLLLYTL